MTRPNPPTAATPTAGSGVPRLGLTREEAAAAIGVSPRTVDALIADRTSGFPVARIGSKPIVPVRELVEWLAERARRARP